MNGKESSLSRINEGMAKFARGDQRPFVRCYINDFLELISDQSDKELLEEVCREICYRDRNRDRKKSIECMEKLKDLIGKDSVRKIKENLPELYRYKKNIEYL